MTDHEMIVLLIQVVLLLTLASFVVGVGILFAWLWRMFRAGSR